MYTVGKLESLIKEDILLLKAFVMRISVRNIKIFSDIVQEIDDIFKNLFHSHTINFHCCGQLVWILQNSIYVLEGYSLVVHVCRILNLWGLGAL